MEERKVLVAPGWVDYELIDNGNYMKLERFGRFILQRPEPQAIWSPALSPQEWNSRADAVFVKNKGGEDKGVWDLKTRMPDRWNIGYGLDGHSLSFRLSLTSFKHVGLFPEQASNWVFIKKSCERLKEKLGRQPNVLNLFAYTGGASLAAAAGGACVTHIDSVKQVVSWAKENGEASSLGNVRWIVDDALKFAKRELKRGRIYDGIILDPPAYGRGPEGEKWVLEDNLPELLEVGAGLTSRGPNFTVLNMYSMGLSATVGMNAVRSSYKITASENTEEEAGELAVRSTRGVVLPLGTFYRYFKE